MTSVVFRLFGVARQGVKSKRFFVLSLLVPSLSRRESVKELASTVDTTLYEITDAVTTVDIVTGEHTLNLSSKQSETNRAESILNSIVANPAIVGARSGARQVPPTDRRYKRLKLVFNRVVSASHAADEIKKSILFVYFDDPLKNAFALDGNKIVFFIGFTEDVNDDKLATVIGHEMADNTASHISEAAASKLLVGLAGGDTDRAGWDEAFTLKQEQEADELGILYATLGGLRPLRGVEVLETPSE